MAESDKIKSNDLIQYNVFDNTTKSAKALEVELSRLVIGFEGIIKANAEMLKLNKDPKTAQGIKDVNAALIENEKLRKAVLIAERELIKNGSEQLKQDRELIRNANERDKQAARELKNQQSQNGAYKQASDRLRDIKKELKDLDVQGKSSTEQFKKLNEEFKKLDGTVRAADAKVGEFGRNVGNYQGKFNGLGNSVNQLTREMPAFANSMQTGFMAISNNLPIFFDEITKAKDGLKAMQAEGQKTPSLFQTIASSIFSWGTALSIGVTLLTVFGKELVILIGNLFKADEAFKLSAKEQTQYNKEFLDRANERIEAMLKIKQLTGEMSQKDVDDFKDKRTLEQRERTAIQKHNSILIRIAEQHKVEIDQLGKMPETGSINIAGITESTYEKNKQINKDFEAEQLRFRNELIDIEKTAIIKRRENQAQEDDRLKKDAEKAAKKATAERKARQKERDDEIIQEMEKIREGREKAQKIMNDFNNKEGDFKPEKTSEIIWYDQENGITLEDHNAQVEYIEKEKEKKRKQDEKDRQEAISAAQKLEQQTTSFLKQELDRRNADKIRALDTQISADEKAIDRQFQLAKEGQDNILAETEARLAKDKLAKQEALEKEQRQKQAIALAEAYLNAYNAELKQPGANPSQAAQKAVADVLLAKGIATGLAALASYYDGTEDTGNGGKIDNKGGFLSVLHPNERVMTAEQNAKIGKSKLSNEKLTDIAIKYNAGQLIDVSPKYNLERQGSFANNIYESLKYQQDEQILKELKSLNQKPVQQVNVDGMMNLIETLYHEGRKEVIIHKGKTRL